jgi:fructose/tagatose bisphosphate aldolase
MSKIGMTLEIELGVTGGEEDGVDNTDIDSSKLYTQPEHVAYAYNELTADQHELHHCRVIRQCPWCLQTREC